MRPRTIMIRESEGAACPRCGRGSSLWKHGIPIDEAVAAIAADRGLPAAMDTGRCPCCEDPFDWDVLIASNGHRHWDVGADESVRRATLHAIRAQLVLGRRPVAIASWIRAELGVVGILVEDCSGVGLRLGYDWSERRDGRPPAR